MGQRHPPAEGVGADPLQARHHHLGLRRLQYLALHPVLDHRQGWSLFHRCGCAQSLWRCDPRRNRKASGPVVDRVRDPDLQWVRRRHQADLKLCRAIGPGYPAPMRDRSGPFRAIPPLFLARIAVAASVWMIAATSGWPKTAAPQPTPPPSPDPTTTQPGGPPPAGTPAPPAAPENPGLFNEMGKALEKSLSILPT